MGNNGDWPEPEPLRRKQEPGEPFPVEALGPVLEPAVKKMYEVIKPPLAICGQSVLAAVNLAVQGHADVEIDGRVFPLSDFFLSIAQSGDRKTAADTAALGPIDARQRVLMDNYRLKMAKYQMNAALWKREFDTGVRDLNRSALESMNPAPIAPPFPQLTTAEPTYEGLIKLLADGWPTVGLFSSEAGRFFGGHAMNKDNRLKTLAGLSEIWDGRPIPRTRAGDGSMLLYGRRLSAHLMMQPVVAEIILSDPLAAEQGFLSRCLIVEPESMLGLQPYEEKHLRNEPAFAEYAYCLSSEKVTV